MSQPQENNQGNSDGNNTARAASVIACAATGFACPMADIERAADAVQDSANINAPPSRPAVRASNEAIQPPGVIAAPINRINTRIGRVTRSQRLLENATAANQPRPIETRPPRVPSRPGVLPFPMPVDREPPLRYLRAIPAEPMEVDKVPTLTPPPPPVWGPTNQSSPSATGATPINNVPTGPNNIQKPGSATANKPANAGNEEREGRDGRDGFEGRDERQGRPERRAREERPGRDERHGRDGRTRRSGRNTSSNPDRIYLCRMRSNPTAPHGNVLSCVRNIADGSASSVATTTKVPRGNTYRAKRDAQKTKNDAPGAKKSATSTSTTETSANDTFPSKAGSANFASGTSKRTSTVTSDEVKRSTGNGSNLNPPPITTTSTATSHSITPCATITSPTLDVAATISISSERPDVIAAAIESITPRIIPVSTNDGTQPIAAVIEIPDSPLFPIELGCQTEVVGEDPAELNECDIIPFAPIIADNESNMDSALPETLIIANENATISDTVSTTSNVIMHSGDVTITSETTVMRAPTPDLTLLSMPTLGVSPAPLGDSGSAIETIAEEIVPKEETASNVAADADEEKKVDEEPIE